MNNSKTISEPIATASSSPSTPLPSKGTAGSASSSSSESLNSNSGDNNSASSSKAEIWSVGGDQKSEINKNDVVKENKDVTAG